MPCSPLHCSAPIRLCSFQFQLSSEVNERSIGSKPKPARLLDKEWITFPPTYSYSSYQAMLYLHRLRETSCTAADVLLPTMTCNGCDGKWCVSQWKLRPCATSRLSCCHRFEQLEHGCGVVICPSLSLHLFIWFTSNQLVVWVQVAYQAE